MTKLKNKEQNKEQKVERGGKREGAGRPHGSGKYGEPTKAMRVPQSLVGQLQQLLIQYGQEKECPQPARYKSLSAPSAIPPRPLYSQKIAAGFPSPADDHVDLPLDLNEYLIKNPTSTFYVRVEGDSMLNAGIHPNDLLVVDRSLKPNDGHIVIAFLNGEFTVKRLKITKNQQFTLMPENPQYSPIAIKEGMDFRIWGVVTNVIHALAN